MAGSPRTPRSCGGSTSSCPLGLHVRPRPYSFRIHTHKRPALSISATLAFWPHALLRSLDMCLRLQNDGKSVQQRDAYTDPGPQERHICPGAVSSKTSPEPVAFWYGMLFLDSGQEIKDRRMTARYKQMQNVVELLACFMIRQPCLIFSCLHMF